MDQTLRKARRQARQRLEELSTSNKSLRGVLWILKNIAIGCADIAIGMLLIVLTTGLKLYAMWPLLFYGGGLVGFRWLVLAACPILVDLTVPIVIIINALLQGFMMIVDTAIVALDAIMEGVNGVIDIINAADKFFTGHKLTNFQFSLVKFPKVPLITYSEFSNTIKALPPTCARFDSVWKIVGFFMQYGLHTYTCPLVRVLWPLPEFYTVAETLLSWTYYGTASPHLFKSGANCGADGSVTTYDGICAGLGVGYLFVEFFFPVLVIFIVMFTIGPGVYRLLSALVYSVYMSSNFLLSLAVLAFDTLAF